MRTLFLASAAAFVVCAINVAQATEMFGRDYQTCVYGPSKIKIVDCIELKTKIWNQRLQAALDGLMRQLDSEQQDHLRVAERTWVQFRDLNCRFYSLQNKALNEILMGECRRAMFEDRASELENAMRP